MTKITLQILAKDILETNYVNYSDCAITRALRRAGYPNLEDAGGMVCEKKENHNLLDHSDNNYSVLNKRVRMMYRYKHDPSEEGAEVPADFEEEIILNI